MIDANDKQTQPIALEQPAKRGRPATGKALSNADRQRAYRERQKAQRNEKPVDEEAALKAEISRNRLILLEEQNRELRAELKALREQLAQRNEKPARTKRHRDEPAAQLPEDTYADFPGEGKWKIEFKMEGSRSWNTLERKWRAVRDDGTVYEPKK